MGGTTQDPLDNTNTDIEAMFALAKREMVQWKLIVENLNQMLDERGLQLHEFPKGFVGGEIEAMFALAFRWIRDPITTYPSPGMMLQASVLSKPTMSG